MYKSRYVIQFSRALTGLFCDYEKAFHSLYTQYHLQSFLFPAGQLYIDAEANAFKEGEIIHLLIPNFSECTAYLKVEKIEKWIDTTPAGQYRPEGFSAFYTMVYLQEVDIKQIKANIE